MVVKRRGADACAMLSQAEMIGDPETARSLSGGAKPPNATCMRRDALRTALLSGQNGLRAFWPRLSGETRSGWCWSGAEEMALLVL